MNLAKEYERRIISQLSLKEQVGGIDVNRLMEQAVLLVQKKVQDLKEEVAWPGDIYYTSKGFVGAQYASLAIGVTPYVDYPRLEVVITFHKECMRAYLATDCEYEHGGLWHEFLYTQVPAMLELVTEYMALGYMTCNWDEWLARDKCEW